MNNSLASLDNSAILILSCDKYSDLWLPFFETFYMNWPKCPYTVYLASNQVEYFDNRVTNILSGHDQDFSSSYKKILKQIPQEYIFVWIEDGFITSPVEEEVIKKGFRFMDKNAANHIHFRPSPKPNYWLADRSFGVYEKKIPYRTNLVGFWRREYLSNLLLEGENAWNFEIMGSYRTSFSDGFYCLKKSPFSYVHLVDKGAWRPEAVRYCASHNIKIDLAKRNNLRFLSLISYTVKKIFFQIIISMPWRLRLNILNFFRKLLASY